MQPFHAACTSSCGWTGPVPTVFDLYQIGRFVPPVNGVGRNVLPAFRPSHLIATYLYGDSTPAHVTLSSRNMYRPGMITLQVYTLR